MSILSGSETKGGGVAFLNFGLIGLRAAALATEFDLAPKVNGCLAK